ncbi:MAG: hypothetical protein WCS97_03695 [Candidatus Paceibacterota bacterium]
MCYIVGDIKKEFLEVFDGKLITQPLVDLYDWLNSRSRLGDHALLSDEETEEFRKRYRKMVILPQPRRPFWD